MPICTCSRMSGKDLILILFWFFSTELKKYKFTLDPNVVAEAKKKCEELAQ
jgi:hypothetical protein